MSGPGCHGIARPLTDPALSLHRFARALPLSVSIPVVRHPDGHGALTASDTHVSSYGGPMAYNV